MGRVGKWVKGLRSDTPVAEAAALVLRARLSPVPRLLPRAVEHGRGTPEATRAVHELRVATRRAAAALSVFRDCVGRKRSRRLGRRLSELRRAAGAVRDLDLQHQRFEREAKRARGSRRTALRFLLLRTAVRQDAAHAGLGAAIDRCQPRRLRRASDELIERLKRRALSEAAEVCRRPFSDLATGALADRIDDAGRAAELDLGNPEALHELRIRLKRLRYALEIFGPVLDGTVSADLGAKLTDLQDQLGTINDAWNAADRIREEIEGLKGRRGALRIGKATTASAAALRRGLGELLAEQERVSREAHDAFVRRWRETGTRPLDALRQAVRADAPAEPREPAPPGARPPTSQIEYKPDLAPRSPGVRASAHHHNGRTPHAGSELRSRRLAAIDVGTNSIRCIIAEATPDGSYRVLDDEKEVARLGRGLHETGEMSAASIAHAAAAIERMRSIAEGHGAAEIRVVATAAAREARNAQTLIDAVRERTGLEVEIIDAATEAQFAYRSASRAFDLSAAPAAVVDIGGGSAQIILSAAGEGRVCGGVVDRVYTLPLGAVRLTERFGGPVACAGDRFDEMRRFVRKAVKTAVGRPPFTPQIVIGTGGTLTALGEMSLRRSEGGAAGGLFNGSVQGYEVTRAELRHLLDTLRKLSLEDRAGEPGLASDRADIIVAGLTLADAVLKRLGANRVRIHEGGIRDGLLRAMVGEGGLEGAGPGCDPLVGARRFAEACRYERAHAEHVAALALELFDQLAGREEGGPAAKRLDARARLLLEAAAVLHDVGYLINYAAHHKHSYHLIVHADLPGLTARDVQVVANVARYHRRAEPKGKHATFAALPREDRDLVKSLAAILRIADGLDRTHTQTVRSIRLMLKSGNAALEVEAEREPGVDVWGAARKSRLFLRVFGLLPHFEWRPSTGTVSRLEGRLNAAEAWGSGH